MSYSGMLYSYKTHIINITFGLASSAKNLAELTALHPKSAAVIWGTALKGLVTKGQTSARDVLATGYRDNGPSGVQAPNELERFKGFWKNLYVAPLRALGAADIGISTGLNESYQAVMLIEEELKKNPNRKRSEVVKEVMQQFDYSGLKHQKASIQAATEVEHLNDLKESLFITENPEVTGKTESLQRNPTYREKKYNNLYRDVKIRAFEILEQKRDAEGNITEDAKDWGREALLMGTPKGTAGAIAAWINNMGNDAPILRAKVTPFVTVPLNIVNMLIDNSPIGLVNSLAKFVVNKRGKESLFLSDEVMKRRGLAENMSPEKRKQLLLKQALGVGVSLSLYGLTQLQYEDDEEGLRPVIRIWADITGDYGKNEAIKMGNEGKMKAPQEWTVDIGGYRAKYKNSPFVAWMAPVAMLSDHEK